MVADKGSQSLVQVLVHNLGLSIYLGVERGRQLYPNSQDSVELSLEFRDKLGSTVRDDSIRGSVSSVDVRDKQLCYILRGCRLIAWDRIGSFT